MASSTARGKNAVLHGGEFKYLPETTLTVDVEGKRLPATVRHPHLPSPLIRGRMKKGVYSFWGEPEVWK